MIDLTTGEAVNNATSSEDRNETTIFESETEANVTEVTTVLMDSTVTTVENITESENLTDYYSSVSSEVVNTTTLPTTTSTAAIVENTTTTGATETSETFENDTTGTAESTETSTLSTAKTNTTIKETTTETAITTTEETSEVAWKFKITDVTYDTSLNDKQSEKYRQLHGELFSDLKSIFSGILGDKFGGVTISKFSSGSVVVEGETSSTEAVEAKEIGSKFYDEVVNNRGSSIGGHEVDPSSITFGGEVMNPEKQIDTTKSASMPGYLVGIVVILVIMVLVVAIIALIVRRHQSHRLREEDYMFDDDGSDGLNGVAVKHWQTTSPRQTQITNDRDHYSGVNMYEMSETGNRSHPRTQPLLTQEGLSRQHPMEGSPAQVRQYGYQQGLQPPLQPTPRSKLYQVTPLRFAPPYVPLPAYTRHRTFFSRKGILRVPVGTEVLDTETSQH